MFWVFVGGVLGPALSPPGEARASLDADPTPLLRGRWPPSLPLLTRFLTRIRKPLLWIKGTVCLQNPWPCSAFPAARSPQSRWHERSGGKETSTHGASTGCQAPCSVVFVHSHCHLFLTVTPQRGTNVPTMQTREARCRGVKGPTQGPTARRWQARGFEL